MVTANKTVDTGVRSTTKTTRQTRAKVVKTVTVEMMNQLLEEQRVWFMNVITAQNKFISQELEKNRLTTSQDFVNLTVQIKSLHEEIITQQQKENPEKGVKVEDLYKFGFQRPEPLQFFPFVRQDGIAAALAERLKTATIPQFQILRQTQPDKGPGRVMTFGEVAMELLAINPKRLVKNFDIKIHFADKQVHLMTPGNKIAQVVEAQILVSKFVSFLEQVTAELGEKKADKVFKKYKVARAPLGYPEQDTGVFPVTKIEDLQPQVG